MVLEHCYNFWYKITIITVILIMIFIFVLWHLRCNLLRLSKTAISYYALCRCNVIITSYLISNQCEILAQWFGFHSTLGSLVPLSFTISSWLLSLLLYVICDSGVVSVSYKSKPCHSVIIYVSLFCTTMY